MSEPSFTDDQLREFVLEGTADHIVEVIDSLLDDLDDLTEDGNEKAYDALIELLAQPTLAPIIIKALHLRLLEARDG